VSAWFSAAGAALVDAAAGLAELVLPATCAACGAAGRTAVCPDCHAALSAVAAPHPVAPTPVPAGLPACRALAPYGGVLRELLLAYKERGRHDLARPLGGLLAAVVAAGGRTPVALVPVPATARAARQRYGDHMLRLATQAARALCAAGVAAEVHRPVRARPKPDSSNLDSAGRARVAAMAFRVRPAAVAVLRRVTGAGAQVVVVDDIVTTGVTLSAVSQRLAAAGVRVDRAAVLAATRRWGDLS
jgi:predicted amidophosphoribosyltransferase